MYKNYGITIVAEAGINHDGNVDTAIKMVSEAKKAGADAIKFQLFTEKARPFGKKFILRKEAWQDVMQEARKACIECFWSVFDFESVSLAKELGAKWVKLSFVERRNSHLIQKCTEAGFKRKFCSIDLYGQYSKEDLDGWELLYCPNNGWSGYYPTELKHIEWERYAAIARITGMGWSCHAVDMYPCLVAASLGATVIEKHFKLDDDCPDSELSLSPSEFLTMSNLIRVIYPSYTISTNPSMSEEERSKIINEIKEVYIKARSSGEDKMVVTNG